MKAKLWKSTCNDMPLVMCSAPMSSLSTTGVMLNTDVPAIDMPTRTKAMPENKKVTKW